MAMTGMGRTTALAACGFALLAGAITSGAGRPTPAPQPVLRPASSSHRAVLQKYCFTCHSTRLHMADLALEALDETKPSEHPEIWEKVIRKLRTQTMPPGGRPRPDDATYDELATWLETNIDRVADANPNPGRTEAFHRLNRAEYQ